MVRMGSQQLELTAWNSRGIPLDTLFPNGSPNGGFGLPNGCPRRGALWGGVVGPTVKTVAAVAAVSCATARLIPFHKEQC
jgi:hypothetical protein